LTDPSLLLDDAPPPSHQGGDFDLGELLGRLRRRWRLIAAVAGLAVAVSLLQYHLTPPAFRAQTTIQIERRNLSPFANSQTPWLENWWNMEYYPTQYALLESRGLAEAVVRELDLVNDPAFNPGVARRASAEPPTADDDEAVIGRLADRLRGGLAVDPQKGTQLVRLSYVAADPKFAARVVNAFAQEFIALGISSRSQTVTRASGFLSQQIEQLKDEIQEREREYQEASRSTDVVDPDPASSVTRQRLQSLNDDYMRVVRERIQSQAGYEELRATPREQVADARSSGLVASLRQELSDLEREYDTQRQSFKPDWPPLVELAGRIEQAERHLGEVIAQEAETAISAAAGELQTLRRQEVKLAAEIERVKEEARDQNLAAVGVANLRVEIDSRKELLDQLLRQQSETAVALNMSTRDGGEESSNVRVIEKALVPRGKFRPDLTRSLALGLFGGLLLGIGGAVLLEFLDRTIKSESELERVLGLPVLAVIPELGESGRGSYGYGYGYGRRPPAQAEERPPARGRWVEKKRPEPVELAPHTRPRQLISEAYRSLRTALLLSSADELRVVAITSAVAGEGKTATTANLAVVLAQLGRRVLVIDGDLRKPRQHQVFGLSNREGLVSHLARQVAGDRITVATQIPNLHVAVAGPMPPNPSELLASERMRELIAQARRQYDVVLIDSPPALAVTDAVIIGSIADGVVLCFRAGQVLREEVRACRERLTRADVRVLGAVLNRQRPKGGRYLRYKGYAETYGAEAETAHTAA
jgi:capsular exopolysaccharide synthesis family protein